MAEIGDARNDHLSYAGEDDTFFSATNQPEAKALGWFFWRLGALRGAGSCIAIQKNKFYLDRRFFNAILMHTIAAHVCILSQYTSKLVEKLQKHYDQRTGFAGRSLALHGFTGAE